MLAAEGDNGGEAPKPVDASTYLEGQLLFDPNKVLLRRVFFLDTEKTKNINPWWRSAILNRLPSSSRFNT